MTPEQLAADLITAEEAAAYIADKMIPAGRLEQRDLDNLEPFLLAFRGPWGPDDGGDTTDDMWTPGHVSYGCDHGTHANRDREA